MLGEVEGVGGEEDVGGVEDVGPRLKAGSTARLPPRRPAWPPSSDGVISTRCGDQAMAAYLMQMLILPSTWQHSFPGSEYVTPVAHVPQRLPSLRHGNGGGGG